MQLYERKMEFMIRYLMKTFVTPQVNQVEHTGHVAHYPTRLILWTHLKEAELGK